MDIKSIVLGIFAAIGVLAVTGYLLYLISKAIKNYKVKKPEFPSSKYMEKVGGRCPSGWIYKGQVTDTSGGKHDVCQNYYNIPVCRDWVQSPDRPDGCYTGPNRITMFPEIKDWKTFLNSDVPDTHRCEWINRCGPPSEIHNTNQKCDGVPPASWIGISDKC
jgi:hypothetical protein